jgi:hypothetical protein
MNRKIWIVESIVGQYEDKVITPEKAFVSKDKAEKYADEQNRYFEELHRKYKNSDIDGEDILQKIFNKYLEDTDKEFYDAYVEADNDTTGEILFEWDDYYDKELEFTDNKELVSKYKDICQIEGKELEALEIFYEWQEKCSYDSDVPYFFVSSREIEIVE